ncbi:AMP-binding protein [Actinomycetospora endophytica]|uniref:AMP-binding protein n=1 Tax=Actinomycetospora endophytica TaxID=2291215 RepID=A0ABS8PJQ6_9PSEU|nr:AMP-binding protein [Actinomycetospora endophytica]MCD2197651.1 AMP-binding protein [Actinomycetospora endophytica]
MSFNWVLDSAVEPIPPAGWDNVAVSFDGRDRLTYRELRERSLSYARALDELGLAKGDRLGLMLHNDAEYLPLYFAAMRLGVIAVRLNFRLAAPELRFILADSGCQTVLIHAGLLDRLEPVREESGAETVVVLRDVDGELPDWALPLEALQGRPPMTDAPGIAPEDPIALLYTSGTTGLPKGALLTHANTVGTATMQALKWRFSERTVALVPGPLYHAGGFEAVTAPVLLAHGTAVCLRSGSFSIEHLLGVIASEQVTDCLLFSFMLGEMLRFDDLETRLPASLDHLIIGGDTMMPWTVAEVRRRMPHVRLTQVFGLTEGGAICTTLDDGDFDAQLGSIGRPLPLAEARVVDDTGRPAEVDEVGEILVRNPGTCGGYWQRPDANRETFVDGWCHTGDLGFVNADGFLTLAGRAKDMIRSGGENVYPAEIEKVLADHPGISDAAVVGVPDPKYLEVGCAVLVLKPDVDLDEEALRAYCRERMAGYKVPKYFARQDELPRNASGKVLKYVLREQYVVLGDQQPAR